MQVRIRTNDQNPFVRKNNVFVVALVVYCADETHIPHLHWSYLV